MSQTHIARVEQQQDQDLPLLGRIGQQVDPVGIGQRPV